LVGSGNIVWILIIKKPMAYFPIDPAPRVVYFNLTATLAQNSDLSPRFAKPLKIFRVVTQPPLPALFAKLSHRNPHFGGMMEVI